MCALESRSTSAWKETVLINIKEFDSATGKGMMRLDAEGASPQHCGNTPFRKVPGKQDIEVVFDRCLSGATATAQYCRFAPMKTDVSSLHADD